MSALWADDTKRQKQEQHAEGEKDYADQRAARKE
jgi:hypothetical protein